MFWNLYASPRVLLADGRTRREQQAAVIARHAPDILVTTECWRWMTSQGQELEETHRLFGTWDEITLHGAKTGGDMAVWTRDSSILISEESQPQEEALWHGYMRMTYRIPKLGPVDIITAHLHPFDPITRHMEISALRNAIALNRQVLILMNANCTPPGDPEPDINKVPLNKRGNQILPGQSTVDRTPLEALASAGLLDVGAEFDPQRQPTAGYYDPSDPLRRLSQAWRTPSMAVRSYRVLNDLSFDPELPTASDNYPILVTL